jgi:hypothetical protein
MPPVLVEIRLHKVGWLGSHEDYVVDGDLWVSIEIFEWLLIEPTEILLKICPLTQVSQEFNLLLVAK